MTTFAGKLLPTQYKFVNEFDYKEVAFIGGYGCGKSIAAAAKAAVLASKNLGVAGCILSPTYGMLIDTLIPTFEEVLQAKGISYNYKASPQPSFTLHFKRGSAKVFCRSAENYRRLNSLNLAWAVVDEADLLDKDSGLAMWKTLQARVRVGPVRQICATSTPEGFNVMHELFVVKGVNKQNDRRKCYHANTLENYHLGSQYAEDLRRDYTANECEAYINGQFTNLKSGTVYFTFNRKDSNSTKTVETFHTEMSRPVLHIGVDFNIGQTVGIVLISDDDGEVHAVDEFVKCRDTDQLIERILARYDDYQIFIYPDSSGKSGQTVTTLTDIALLKDAFGPLNVKYPNKNPRIMNRVKSVNAMFLNGKGDRRLFINKQTCPTLTTSLEQQAYSETTGLPEKTHNVDHPLDALGYMIHFNFAIIRPPTMQNF